MQCSEEHKANPNFPERRNKTIREQSRLTFEDMFKVNPRHRITEEKAESLPLHRKLRIHFAENACNHALERLCEVDKDILQELRQKELQSPFSDLGI